MVVYIQREYFMVLCEYPCGVHTSNLSEPSSVGLGPEARLISRSVVVDKRASKRSRKDANYLSRDYQSRTDGIRPVTIGRVIETWEVPSL
jgi:hypothetical protein